MIGLRILHLATSPEAAAAGDVLTLMTWLRANGHHAALAAGGEGEIPGYEVFRYRAKAPAWWLGGKKELFAAVAEWNPDLIHLHGGHALPAARALAKRLSLPVVVSVARSLEPVASRGLRDPCVSWVLVPTEAHRAHFVGRVRIDRDHVSVLPFAVEMDGEMRAPTRVPDRTLTIGMVLADDGGGGIAPGLEAVALLRRDEVPIRVVVGIASGTSAELRDEFAASVLRVNGKEWVEAIAVSSARALIERCDVLLHPALVDGSAAAVIEALAAGRPVVATAVGGLPEMVRDGVSGLLVAPGDATAIAVALGGLVRDGELRRRLGEAARADALDRFAIAVVAPAAVELYRAAISAAQNVSAKAEGSRAYQRRVSDTHHP